MFGALVTKAFPRLGVKGMLRKLKDRLNSANSQVQTELAALTKELNDTEPATLRSSAPSPDWMTQLRAVAIRVTNESKIAIAISARGYTLTA